MDTNRPVSYDLADYLGMLRRHWWMVALLVLVGVGGADAVVRTQPKVYEAATSVLVTPSGAQSGGNAAGGRTNSAINMDTEAQLVVSNEIAVAAQKLLKVATPPDRLAASVTVTVPPNTTVLAITYSAGSPKEAQSGSHAFAIAYLQSRQTTAQADLTTQISALDAKVKQYSAALSQLSSRLAGLKAGDPNKADLNSQVATLTSQINTLTSRENDLSTAQVTAGKIINDAQLPTVPSRPSVPLFLASGAMLALVLGISVALVWERTDKRVRRATDVARRDDVPVLGTLPVRTRLDDVYPPLHGAGRTFNRLRNEVLASLAEGDRTIVVTGASQGVAASLVAVNLAAALARGGAETVLVCAQQPETGIDAVPAHQILGVAPAAGLSDVLAGTVALPDAIQPVPRSPNLRVLTSGRPGSAGGLLQSQSPRLEQALREILARLRTETGYVVIEAPSTATSADAQSLASLADAAILAVELRRTRHVEIVDAGEQLRRVGTPLLGAVVFPRLRRRVAGPTPPPPPAAAITLVPPTPGKQRTIRRPVSPGGTGRPGPGHLPIDGSAPADETVFLVRVDEDQ